jgi:DNA repair protein SbcC/Rad50
MIESVHLRNFQCHKDLLVELNSHVTTIVGPSDAGKSAVIRALRWAALNVPVGCMIRDGAKQASVELIVDGRRIVRIRGSENSYSLDGKEFRAFRSDVPDEIATLLNLTDANFQGQHDPLYWFSSTAGDVSRQLNDVVNLAVIDRTLAEAARQVAKCKTVLENAEENLSRSVAEKNELKWVVEADDDLKVAEAIEKKWIGLKSESERLSERIKTIRAVKSEAERNRAIANDSERLLENMVVLGKASKAAAELAKLITAAREAETRKNVEIPDLSALEAIVELLKDRRERTRILSKLLNEVWTADENKGEAKRAFQKALDELESKTEGICPLCGGKL